MAENIQPININWILVRKIKIFNKFKLKNLERIHKQREFEGKCVNCGKKLVEYTDWLEELPYRYLECPNGCESKDY